MPRRTGVLPQPLDHFARGRWPDGPPRKGAPVAARYAQLIAKNLESALDGRSIAEVADAASLARSTIHDIVAGRSWPDIVSLVKLETVLEVRLWPDLQPAVQR